MVVKDDNVEMRWHEPQAEKCSSMTSWDVVYLRFPIG